MLPGRLSLVTSLQASIVYPHLGQGIISSFVGRLKVEAHLVTLRSSQMLSGQVLRVSSSVWIIVSTLAMAPIPVSPQTKKAFH